MARYGEEAKKQVEKTMREFKAGKLKSGRNGKKVSSERQALAIGLAQARRKGGKVPAAAGAK